MGIVFLLKEIIVQDQSIILNPLEGLNTYGLL